MSRVKPAAFALLLVFLPTVLANAGTLSIVPTTTLTAETANNTSAANLFRTTSNGDLGPGNVSKVDIRTLLYPGYSGQVYAHLMGWFCMNAGSTATGAGTKCGSHIQVGYKSSDPARIHAQVEDMISRGIDGVIHDWYGKGSPSDTEAQNMIAEAQTHPGFSYAIMIDKGAISWWSCYPGCSATQAITQIAQYAANTYFSSPSYMRVGGRPVLFTFGVDSGNTIDWNYVAANTPGNPIWVFQSNGGFTHAQSGGSYAWVMPDNPNYGLDYLSGFYSTGNKYPSLFMVGATYKGFNDTLASWSANRVMGQQCGQTWLQTFARINSTFNTANPLDGLQLVTWDDYEEGTEIESGIDNCVTVSGALSGNVLRWTITGSESTIDHYTVFISTDGENLMPLGDFAAGTRQLDLASFSLAGGNYTLYVKAVGKPSLRNQMSPAVAYTASGTTTVAAPKAVLSLSAATAVAPATITASTSGSTADAGTAIASSSINWGDGTSSAGPAASHAYNAAGAYTVTATVTDGSGRSSTAAQAVTIKPAAVYITAPANGATLTSPVHVTAYAVSGRKVDSMIIYLDSADAYLTYSSSLDTYLAMAPGVHTILVKSWDNTGVITQSQVKITVVTSTTTTPPAAVLSLSTAYGLAPLSVTASTSGSRSAGGTITSSVINWGDGASSTATTATHTYTKPGVYTVTGTVKDSLGLSASKSASVNAAGIVISSPVAGSSSSSPMLVAAKAVDANAIDAMYVYVDGMTRYSIFSNSFSTYISMGRGTHKIVIKAWEKRSGGLILQSTTTVTVP